MKSYILLLAFLTGSLISPAQVQVLSVGNTNSLTIKAGTIFSADSLVLIPGADLTLSSNNIQVTPVAVNLVPHPSINRVYYLGSPISFTGTLQLYYQPSELNGIPENTLQLTDSTTGVPWKAESGSTVNTGSHFVQYAAAGHSFIAATASGPVAILPLSLISFAGSWDQSDPSLQWVVSQTGEIVNFAVESSSDAADWKTIGTMDGLNNNGVNTYGFKDADPAAHTMYYRIRLIEPSGAFTYSYIIKLRKGGNDNDMRLIVTNNAVSVRFSGTLPTGIRLVNISGMILRVDNSSRQEYDLSGLAPGAYFIQYAMNGQWTVREFVVQ
jgi:hypothetical protein